MEAVVDRVLTPEYVLSLVEEVNAVLFQDNSGLEWEINSARKELAEVDRAINNLLDLAERYGEAAGTRLREREAERQKLVSQL